MVSDGNNFRYFLFSRESTYQISCSLNSSKTNRDHAFDKPLGRNACSGWAICPSGWVLVHLKSVYTIQPVVNRVDKRFDNRLYRVYKQSAGCQTGLTTGLTTGCICKRGFSLHVIVKSCSVLRLVHVSQLKPNSITLAGSELAPNILGASSELVRS